MKSFRDLVESSVACGMSIIAFADWCQLSRQQIYKYMNGDVNPLNVSYINITNMATYLDASPDEVYNCICESYESKRIWCDTLGKWMLPEELIKK